MGSSRKPPTSTFSDSCAIQTTSVQKYFFGVRFTAMCDRTCRNVEVFKGSFATARAELDGTCWNLTERGSFDSTFNRLWSEMHWNVEERIEKY